MLDGNEAIRRPFGESGDQPFVLQAAPVLLFEQLLQMLLLPMHLLRQLVRQLAGESFCSKRTIGFRW